MTDLPADRVLRLLSELKAAYNGFNWESSLWAECGHHRSPYRTLVLFGLSARTKDALLVEMCRDFFRRFPTAAMLAESRSNCSNLEDEAGSIVRLGQLPYVLSMAQAVAGGVPRERADLLSIKGVGDKISECVLAYGWGDEALPLDANCVRVLDRVFGPGLAAGRRRTPAPLREGLKCVYLNHPQEYSDVSIRMVDIHEILRLHGQVCCRRTPECARCPVSGCLSRRGAQTEPGGIQVSPLIWDDWRELINEPVPV